MSVPKVGPLPNAVTPPCGGGGGDDGGDGTMSATVILRDDPSDRIMSDGLGSYVDGEHKVSTAIGHEGSFYLQLTKTKKQATRTLKFDFSSCAATPCLPPQPCESNCIPVTGKVSGGGVNLSTMDVDATLPIALFMVVNFGNDNERVFFIHYDASNHFDSDPVCPSADADVTRMALDTWVIEGTTACLVRPGGARDPAAVRGTYNMPFKMTVTTN